MNQGTPYRQILLTPLFMINVTYIMGNMKDIGSGCLTCQITNLVGYPLESNRSSKLRLVKMFLPERALFNMSYPHSRMSRRVQEQNAYGKARPLMPKTEPDDGSSSNEELYRPKYVTVTEADRTIKHKAEITRAPQKPQQRKTTHCTFYNEQPSGFHGDHELRRHIERHHSTIHKVRICQNRPERPTSRGDIIDDQTEYPVLEHLTYRFACSQADCKEPQTCKLTIRSSRFIPSDETMDTGKKAQEPGRAVASASEKTTEKSILVTLEEELEQTDRGIKNRPRYSINTAKGAYQMAPAVADSSTATAGINIRVERYMQHERNRPRPRPAMISPDDDDDDDTIGFQRASYLTSCKASTSNRHGSSNYSQNFLRSISSNKPYVAAQHKSKWKQLSWKCNDAAVAAIWRAVIARTCGQLPTLAWIPCVGTEDFVSDAGMHQMSLFVSVA
jgi:hypothetical protein